MMPLSLEARHAANALSIVCVGTHADEVEIGCGGTILRLSEQYPQSTFHWVVLSATGVREAEAQRAASLFTGPTCLKGLLLKAFPDGFMPFVGADIKAVFDELKATVSPDLIFTHNRKDAHQDPRLLAELTWNTVRAHLILEYEIPKYDGDMGKPNVFIPIESELCEKKVRYILEAFPSQATKRWFRQDTFLSMMR